MKGFEYPAAPIARDRWVVSRRGKRNRVDPERPYAFLLEEERRPDGEVGRVATIFLTNRECPWKCLMCDLWKNTTADTLEPGMIPAQIAHALDRLPQADTIKLYNAGSFFDPGAIPREDHESILRLVRRFNRVIVECHPSLVKKPVVEFAQRLDGRLEVAMGLETAHAGVLEQLNKRVTLEGFRAASEFLGDNGIDIRVFVMVKPPFMNDEAEALQWACRSIDFAFQCGAGVVALIPTRGGNGAMEALAAQGLYAPPKLATLERALDYGISLDKGRVFADLWDLEQFSACPTCFTKRYARMEQMNLSQDREPGETCAVCGWEAHD